MSTPEPDRRTRRLPAGESIFVRLVLSLALVPLLSLANASRARASGESPRKVLVLYTAAVDQPATLLVDQTIRATLKEGSKERIEVFTENLNLSRFPQSGYAQKLVEHYRFKYAIHKIDLVIAVYSQALEFLIDHGEHLFPGVPIVFCAVYEKELKEEKRRSRAIGIPATVDMAGTLSLALALHPDTRRIAVIAGASENDRTWVELARQNLRDFEGKVDIDYLVGLPLEELLTRVANLPEKTLVFYLQILRDGNGQAFIPRDVLDRLSRASKSPIYGLYDTYVGHGIVGGRVVSFEAEGRIAARLALRVLAGEKPEPMRDSGETSDAYQFDWRQLRRWGIGEERLPAGSVVRFRQPSLWEQYWGRIVGVVSLCFVVGGLLGGLLVQRAGRRRVEAALTAAEERRSLAAEAAELGMWSWEVQTQLVWMTRKGQDLLGLVPETELNYPAILNCLHPEDREFVDRSIRNALTENRDYDIEFRVLLPGGAIRWLGAKGRAYGSAAGQSQHMQSVLFDVTRRKEADLEQQQHREEVAHACRVATMGELAASLAHELSQPLGAIHSNAAAALLILQADAPELGEIREILSDIRKDDERANGIIHRMRSLIKRHQVTKQELDLNKLTREIVQVVGISAGSRRCAIDLELEAGLPAVEGDPIHLQQVLLNLMLNGMDAMAGRPAAHRRLVLATRRKDEQTVEVTVTDCGTGIAAEHLARIFDRFYTTKQDGLGMGLSIARTIIEAHGGHIAAENNPGGGATLRILLPFREETPR